MTEILLRTKLTLNVEKSSRVKINLHENLEQDSRRTPTLLGQATILGSGTIFTVRGKRRETGWGRMREFACIKFGRRVI